MTPQTTNGQETKRNVKISGRTLVKVRSNVYGSLHYVNPFNGYRIVWPANGDVQLVEFDELARIKNTTPAFFQNQWVLIMGVGDGEACKASADEICRALAIDQYYKGYLDPSAMTNICEWDDKTIADRVAVLSDSAKANLVATLNGYIASGKLDSLRKIAVFEKALGCELTK